MVPRSCRKKISEIVAGPRHSPAPEKKPRKILPTSSDVKFAVLPHQIAVAKYPAKEMM